MAFTADERVQIRFALGWSARFFQTDSRLEQAMNAVEQDEETSARVRDLLTSVEDIRTKLTAAHGRLKAARLGGIELSGATEIMMLRMEGRRHVGSLAAIFGVEVRHDIFGSSLRGTPLDVGGGHSGGGNFYRHG